MDNMEVPIPVELLARLLAEDDTMTINEAMELDELELMAGPRPIGRLVDALESIAAAARHVRNLYGVVVPNLETAFQLLDLPDNLNGAAHAALASQLVYEVVKAIPDEARVFKRVLKVADRDVRDVVVQRILPRCENPSDRELILECNRHLVIYPTTSYMLSKPGQTWPDWNQTGVDWT